MRLVPRAILINTAVVVLVFFAFFIYVLDFFLVGALYLQNGERRFLLGEDKKSTPIIFFDYFILIFFSRREKGTHDPAQRKRRERTPDRRGSRTGL